MFVFCKGQTLFNSPEKYFGSNEKQAYLEWAQLPTTSVAYNTSLFLPSATDEANGVAVHWKINNDTISLAVAARADGWVAFGLSENGGMFGSDVVAFEAAKPDSLRDLHILTERNVIDDSCNSWAFVDSLVSGGFLVLEARRKLDPNDPQDRALIPDGDNVIPATRIIAAWGDQETVSYHGANRARGAARFYGSGVSEDISFQQAMAKYATGSFVVGAKNHVVQAVDTDYAYFCASTEDIFHRLSLPGIP